MTKVVWGKGTILFSKVDSGLDHVEWQLYDGEKPVTSECDRECHVNFLVEFSEVGVFCLLKFSFRVGW